MILISKNPILIILAICIILIGGYFLIGFYQEKKLVNHAQKEAESFLYRNYGDINEVTVNKENYEFDPMGGLSIGGHVNGKPELYFNIMFDTPNNQVDKVTSVVKPKEFPPNKEECKNKYCQ